MPIEQQCNRVPPKTRGGRRPRELLHEPHIESAPRISGAWLRRRTSLATFGRSRPGDANHAEIVLGQYRVKPRRARDAPERYPYRRDSLGLYSFVGYLSNPRIIAPEFQT